MSDTASASGDDESAYGSDDFPEAMSEDDADSMPPELQSAATHLAEMLARERQEAEDARVSAAIEAEEQRVERDRLAAAHADGLRAKAELERLARRSRSKSTSYYDAAALQACFAEDYAAEQWAPSRCLNLNRTVVRCLGDSSCSCGKLREGTTSLLCNDSFSGGKKHSSIASDLKAPSVFVNQLSTAYVHLSYRRDAVITVGNHRPKLQALRERGMIHLPEARALLTVLQLLESMHGLATIRFARRVLEQLFFVAACPV
mmetsp:Transcript_6357/g.12723  ORF Transcript_6357/g.12723 Transcript_6357/m.12723 type:complete len:260 (-) Transcript_6357:34-813(-)|eukprot:CAMPEP_0119057824 /NCGR_PEP_ID=MMETSP1178-20130426/2214_1 /TAXON_ID=33656 /ORGANISM="unid sp, Strain CCMP2000" /LENGTH=259 /DNA_ID=CAMNT_0007038687 /DNA_START=67 /DNA_END=846 /DNA_ORIENTATION=-